MVAPVLVCVFRFIKTGDLEGSLTIRGVSLQTFELVLNVIGYT